MSRSRRKTPIIGNGSSSEKQDKRIANRRIRSAVRQALSQTGSDEDLPAKKELSNPWDWTKDGKRRIDSDSESMRK